MKKLLIISLLSISLPALAQEPQDSTSLDIQDILDQNFNKQVYNLTIDDVNEFQEVGETGEGGGEVEPEGEWVTIVKPWSVKKTTYHWNLYCDGVRKSRSSSNYGAFGKAPCGHITVFQKK